MAKYEVTLQDGTTQTFNSKRDVTHVVIAGIRASEARSQAKESIEIAKRWMVGADENEIARCERKIAAAEADLAAIAHLADDEFHEYVVWQRSGSYRLAAKGRDEALRFDWVGDVRIVEPQIIG